MIYRRKTLIFLGCIGALLALYATYITIEVNRYGTGIPTPCSINEIFDCNSVAASKSALLFSIPVAWWGFLYYIWLGLLSTWSLFKPSNSHRLVKTVLLVTIFAVVFALFKAYELFFVIKTICIVCVMMYATNLAILLALTKTEKSWFGNIASWAELKNPVEVVQTHFPGLISWIAIILLGYIFYPGPTPHETIPGGAEFDNLLRAHFSQEAVKIQIPDDAPVRGNSEARITIVEFADFQCRSCMEASHLLKDILSEFPDEVRLVFVNFPLDHSVNPYVSVKKHKYAGLAARAAFYAYDRGDFWSFHDDLFQNQNVLNEPEILRLAEKRGWDTDDFTSTINSEVTADRLLNHIKSAWRNGIEGTPAIFINGRKVKMWYDPIVLSEIIEQELLLTEG